MTTQSQQILEDDSVARLTATGYAKVDVTDETSILENLKARLEACNSFSMTAREFNRVLWKQHIRCHQFQQRGDLPRLSKSVCCFSVRFSRLVSQTYFAALTYAALISTAIASTDG